MKFKKTKYYNEDFLGKNLYGIISSLDKIFTIQEFFGINDKQKEYIKDGKDTNEKYYSYKLVIYKDYYELNCQDCYEYLYLIFDKPVHIIGKYCEKIIAPEIIVKNSKNTSMFKCVSNKLVVSNINNYYEINYSKIKNVYFYSLKVDLWYSEINIFFIFDKNLCFKESNSFLNYHKIKCVGECEDLKDKMLSNKNFIEGIIHIE